MTRRRLTRYVLVMTLAAGPGPATAFETEVQRYYESMTAICRTGVTPAMTAAWVQAVRALEAARYGSGRDGTNFGGIKSPEATWLDCLQSPGEGKE